MSVHEPPKFTPAQVLEAGRRAELEGRTEYAQQFYRHLTDHYPGSSEAVTAQGLLARMAGVGQPTTAGRRPAPPPLPAAPPSAFEPARFEALGPAGSPLTNPFEAPRPPEPPPAQPYRNGYAAPSLSAPPPPQQHSEPQAEFEPLVELPRQRSDYRSGRFLARFFAWLGGAMAVVGLAMAVVGVLNPRIGANIPLIGAMLRGPTTGAILVLAGLFQIMVGQVVRAVLDHANAVRDLAAIARAEAEARHGSGSARPRRR